MRVRHCLRVARFSLAMTLVVALSATVSVMRNAGAQDSPQGLSRQRSRDATWIRLHADFVGCWKGTVQGEDFKPAIPGNTMSQDPTTYELCYGRCPKGPIGSIL
jgi:hypothetical protein